MLNSYTHADSIKPKASLDTNTSSKLSSRISTQEIYNLRPWPPRNIFVVQVPLPSEIIGKRIRKRREGTECVTTYVAEDLREVSVRKYTKDEKDEIEKNAPAVRRLDSKLFEEVKRYWTSLREDGYKLHFEKSGRLANGVPITRINIRKDGNNQPAKPKPQLERKIYLNSDLERLEKSVKQFRAKA